jgi:VanZ family protein
MLKFLSTIHSPQSTVIRKIIPLLYAFFLQLITGIPKPEALDKFDAAEIAIRLSEQLYDYPFWLQDLSHLPLFFAFTWMAHWFFTEKDLIQSISKKAISLSIFYAMFNEGIQAIIPARFPSLGDLVMNLAGVVLAILAIKICTNHITTSA